MGQIKMKIYKDRTLKQEVKTLDLGVVEAGDTKEFSFYVYNDLDADLQFLQFSVKHPEVHITKAPQNLSKKTSEELKIKWTPSVTLKEGLKAELNIRGVELWG